MDLPWTARAPMEPGSDYPVMASRLPLATADGLLAQGYWTLPVWRNEAALREFMRTPPHAGPMTSLRPLMAPAKFATWKISPADGRPDMAGALERLETDSGGR